MRHKLVCMLFLAGLAFGYSQSAEAQSLTEYAKQKQRDAEERQRVERQKYEQACQKKTLEAFREYINLYPDGKYVSDVRRRIADFDLWDKAKSENTITAYNRYLQTSEFKYFEQDASDAINRLKAIEEWNRVRLSESIDDLERYISQYPKSNNVSEAQRRIHELKGVTLFGKSDYRGALKEFDQAGGRSGIQSSNRASYDRCVEYKEYSVLSSSSTDAELRGFLSKYPASQYASTISNLLALSKARQLTGYSLSSEYDDAMRYAKDDATRRAVSQYIDWAKEAKKRYWHAQKVQAHKDWWRGRVRLGWTIFSFGMNEDALDLRSGLRLRFGRHSDFLNLILGCDYAYHGIREGDIEEPEIGLLMHQIGFSGNVRLNLIKCGVSKIYLGCETEYSLRLKDGDYSMVETDYWGVERYSALTKASSVSLSPQFGFNCKHFDIGAFYRVYLNNHELVNEDLLENGRFGAYMTVYF